MHDAMILLLAVAGGWVLQLYMTYRQSSTFNRQVVQLRQHGKVAVGVAGNRYRGGRAFVAIAVDDARVVRSALTLRGWTTLAGGRVLAPLVDVKLSHVLGDKELPGLSRPEREAAREAARTVRGVSPAPTGR